MFGRKTISFKKNKNVLTEMLYVKDTAYCAGMLCFSILDSVPVQEGWTLGNAYYTFSCIFCISWDTSYCVGSLHLRRHPALPWKETTACALRMTCDTSKIWQFKADMLQLYILYEELWHIFCRILVLFKGAWQHYIKVDWSHCQESRRRGFHRTHFV
jgi:hypothetical protein